MKSLELLSWCKDSLLVYYFPGIIFLTKYANEGWNFCFTYQYTYALPLKIYISCLPTPLVHIAQVIAFNQSISLMPCSLLGTPKKWVAMAEESSRGCSISTPIFYSLDHSPASTHSFPIILGYTITFNYLWTKCYLQYRNKLHFYPSFAPPATISIVKDIIQKYIFLYI